MAIFGFAVLCVLAALFALLLLGVVIVGSVYIVSYILCDFTERKRRWAVEARDKQVYTYIKNLSKYKEEDDDEDIHEIEYDEEPEYSETECEQEKDNTACEDTKSEYDDVIDNALNK